MVNALIIGEKIFTLNAISILMGNRLKNLPTNKNSGLPGGCGTPKIWEVAINSPVSQKDTVGAIVEKYTANVMRKITPAIRFSNFLL